MSIIMYYIKTPPADQAKYLPEESLQGCERQAGSLGLAWGLARPASIEAALSVASTVWRCSGPREPSQCPPVLRKGITGEMQEASTFLAADSDLASES